MSRLRERFPDVTVADIYEEPTLGSLAVALDAMAPSVAARNRPVRPVPRATQLGQTALTIPLRSVTGLRWATWVAAANNLASGWLGIGWLPTAPWWVVGLGWLLLITPLGRMGLTVLGARLLMRGVVPGEYPRGGTVHLRVWAAERLADELGAANIVGAPWMRLYARALGASVGRQVDLHAIPPVTGMLELGDECSIEPEVDLSGHWLDGDVLRLGRMAVGKRARVGARSMLCPGASVGDGAEVAPGSAVFGSVPPEQAWAGAPARPRGKARGPWNGARPDNRPAWQAAYAAMALTISLLPVVSVAAGVAAAWPWISGAGSLGQAAGTALVLLPLAVLVSLTVLAASIWALVRLLGRGLTPGHHAIHGRQAWKAWSIIRVLDEARTWLFPLYASSLTPAWLRVLGAKVGHDVEASTVLLIPTLTTVNEGAFLADDTLPGGYEARWRLASHRAGEDWQTRLCRELRHGWARPPGPQTRARRSALRGHRAAPRPRPGRRGSAAHLPSCGVRWTTATPATPTTRHGGYG